MPTIPPERARSAEPAPRRARSLAESFGADPERYDRARPRYPDAMVARIIAESPGGAMLDVGTGTGIAARQFQAAGCQVLGVEVDARMAQWAGASGLRVETAAFEEWDPAGRVFDAVISGQTWHWLDPRVAAVRGAEALRPGGRLAVFWNAALPSAEVTQALSAVYRRVLPDSLASRQWATGLDGYSQLCVRAVDGIRATGAFLEPERWRFDWERSYTRDEWLDQLPTTGGHTQLPPMELAEVAAAVGDAIDALGGSFTMRYATLVVIARRAGATEEAPAAAPHQ